MAPSFCVFYVLSHFYNLIAITFSIVCKRCMTLYRERTHHIVRAVINNLPLFLIIITITIIMVVSSRELLSSRRMSQLSVFVLSAFAVSSVLVHLPTSYSTGASWMTMHVLSLGKLDIGILITIYIYIFNIYIYIYK